MYREWAQLHEALLAGRPQAPDQAERQLLRERGRTVLASLLDIVAAQRLLYIAPLDDTIEVGLLQFQDPTVSSRASLPV
jgi:hypothetical protein